MVISGDVSISPTLAPPAFEFGLVSCLSLKAARRGKNVGDSQFGRRHELNLVGLVLIKYSGLYWTANSFVIF